MQITGPNEDNLKKLYSLIGTMAEGINDGKIAGWKPPNVNGSKACVACCKIFGKKNTDGTLKPDVCKECRKTLLAGGTIFVCDDQRMVKIVPKKGSTVKVKPSYAGRIIKVPKNWMDDLEKMTPAPKLITE